MRVLRIKISVFALMTAVFPLVVSSASAQSRVRGVARLGGEFGGEKVLQFEYEDGSTPNVTAGGGLLLTVGGVAGVMSRGAHALEAQLNLGLKYRTIPPATNQDVTWLRFPVEGLLFYRTPAGFRLGAGATVHLGNAIEASGGVANGRVEFKSNPGLLLQVEYVRRNVAFDLRYTALEYELASGGSGTVDASSIGAGLSYFFGRSSTPN